MMPTMDVRTTPIEGTVLVEASAGTGKTWTIGALLVRLLAEGRELQELLILTFTEAATADLRDRMRRRLEESLTWLEDRPGAPEDLLLKEMVTNGAVQREVACKRLRLALSQFDEASIFTIHGFCRRVLGEAGLGAGLGGPVTLGERSGEALERVAQDQLRRWWAGLPDMFMVWLSRQKGGSGRAQQSLLEPSLWADMAQRAGEGRVDEAPAAPKAIEQAVWQAAQHILHHRSLQETCRHCFDTLGVEGLLEDLLRRKLNAGSYKAALLQGQLASVGDWLHGDACCEEMPKRMSIGLWYFTTSHLARCATAKSPEPNPHPFFDAMEALEKACGDMAQSFALLLRALQVEAVSTWPARAAALRLEERGLDFNDLLSRVLLALRGDQGLRLRQLLQQRWKVALLDEFQDTDPVQSEIFRLLFQAAGQPMVLVGDPKQAIYGFRGADLDAYLGVAATADHCYALATNWRSAPPLVEAVNQLFQVERLPVQGPFLNTQVSYSPVEACPVPNDRAVVLRGKELRAFHVVQEAQSAFSRERLESRICRHVALVLEQLLDPGQARWIQRSTGADLGEIRGEEIAVLVRSNQQGQRIAQALAERGLACIQGGRDSVWASPEARWLTVLLQAMERPADSGLAKALLACGLAQALGAAAGEALGDGHMLLRVQEEVHAARALAQSASPSIALESFLDRTRWRDAMLAQPLGERRVVNWNHLVELVRQEESHRRMDPGAVVRLIQARSTEPRPSSEWEQRLESEDNLVRIVTMHKSKGLEYPLVLCPFLWAGSGRDEAFGQWRLPALPGEKEGRRVLVSPGMPRDGEDVAAYEDAKLAEALRLAYVALTRAKSQLILHSAAPKRGKSSPSPLDWLLLGTHLESGSHPGKKEPWTALDAGGAEMQLEAWRKLEAEGRGVGVEVLEVAATGTMPPPSLASKDAASLPLRVFHGALDTREASSSFTSLLRDAHADERLDEWFGPQEGPAEAEDGLDPEILGERDAWAQFPAGSAAGICLHTLLEKGLAKGGVELRACEEELRASGLGVEHATFLAPRLDAVLRHPLGLGGPVPLQVDARSRATELAFHLSTRGLPAGRLRDLCADHGLHSAARLGVSEPATLTALEAATRRDLRAMGQGFLKGFMDLCVRWEERWWVVDWKSNRLAPNARGYTRECMVRAMAHSGYFLQALLYLTALHRHLRRVDKTYDPVHHMGGLRYVFLRGVRVEDPDNGVLTHSLPLELILDLDREMGSLA